MTLNCLKAAAKFWAFWWAVALQQSAHTHGKFQSIPSLSSLCDFTHRLSPRASKSITLCMISLLEHGRLSGSLSHAYSEAIMTVSFFNRYRKCLSLGARCRQWCWSLRWEWRRARAGGQWNCIRGLLASSYVSVSWFGHAPDSYTICGYYLRLTFISLWASKLCSCYSRVATIQGRCLFQEIRYSPVFSEIA